MGVVGVGDIVEVGEAVIRQDTVDLHEGVGAIPAEHVLGAGVALRLDTLGEGTRVRELRRFLHHVDQHTAGEDRAHAGVEALQLEAGAEGIVSAVLGEVDREIVVRDCVFEVGSFEPEVGVLRVLELGEEAGAVLSRHLVEGDNGVPERWNMGRGPDSAPEGAGVAAGVVLDRQAVRAAGLTRGLAVVDDAVPEGADILLGSDGIGSDLVVRRIDGAADEQKGEGRGIRVLVFGIGRVGEERSAELERGFGGTVMLAQEAVEVEAATEVVNDLSAADWALHGEVVRLVGLAVRADIAGLPIANDQRLRDSEVVADCIRRNEVGVVVVATPVVAHEQVRGVVLEELSVGDEVGAGQATERFEGHGPFGVPD